MNASSNPVHPNDLTDLLDCTLGATRRGELADQVSRDPQSALELRLLLALDASALELATQVRQPAAARTPWFRFAIPAAAAALMLLVWPQQRLVVQEDAVASTAPVSNADVVFNVSFEVDRDDRFVGGFE